MQSSLYEMQTFGGPTQENIRVTLHKMSLTAEPRRYEELLRWFRRVSRRRAHEVHTGRADDAPWLWRRRTFRGASLQLHTVKGNRATPVEHYAIPERTRNGKTLCGDDKNFCSESCGIELAKNESAIGRVWARGGADILDKPADDNPFAHQQLAKDFNITKICLEAQPGGVLEWGYGPAGTTVVENTGAAHALL